MRIIGCLAKCAPEYSSWIKIRINIHESVRDLTAMLYQWYTTGTKQLIFFFLFFQQNFFRHLICWHRIEVSFLFIDEKSFTDMVQYFILPTCRWKLPKGQPWRSYPRSSSYTLSSLSTIRRGEARNWPRKWTTRWTWKLAKVMRKTSRRIRETFTLALK